MVVLIVTICMHFKELITVFWCQVHDSTVIVIKSLTKNTRHFVMLSNAGNTGCPMLHTEMQTTLTCRLFINRKFKTIQF